MAPAAGRSALLDAGLALFAERGFEGASTRAIAQRAGVPQGLVRHHFGSKEALFREVVDAGLRAGAAALQASQASAGPQPADQSEPLLCAALHAGPLLALVVHALLEPGARRAWLVEQRLRPLLQRQAPALADVLHRPSPLRDQDALALVGALVAPLLLAPVLAARSVAVESPAPVLSRLLRQSLDALLAPGPGSVRSAGAWAPLGSSTRRR